MSQAEIILGEPPALDDFEARHNLTVRTEIEQFRAKANEFLAGDISEDDFRGYRLRFGCYGQRQAGVQTTYTNRERQRMGSCRPSRWLVGSSVVDLLIASALAIFGIAKGWQSLSQYPMKVAVDMGPFIVWTLCLVFVFVIFLLLFFVRWLGPLGCALMIVWKFST